MSFDFSGLVTDRSQADLDTLRALLSVPLADWTAEQLAEFNQVISKGAYNYTDLNRVTTCMDYLNEVLTEMGYVTGYQPIIVHPEAGPVVDANTLLLIHGGAVEDASIYDVPITNSGVTVSQAQSKFGGGSLYFNGASRLLIPQTTIYFGSNNFTIDWWEYCGSMSVRNGTRFCSEYTQGQLGLGGLLCGYSQTLLYASSVISGSWDLVSNATMFSVTPSQWVHWAVIRNGNSLVTYRNGTQFATTPINGSISYDTSYPMAIGDYREGDHSYFIGYIDEFRISDVARWTENFTPPTEPYIVERPADGSPTEWLEEDVPTLTQMQRYLGNVSALRVVLEMPEDTAAVPEDMAGLTLEEANAIEDILESIEGWIQGMMQAWFYSGEIYAGEV